MALTDNKYAVLLLSLLFDGVGMLSFSVLGLGEFSDLIWAPLAAWLMTRLYKGKAGKTGGIIAFVEEILPGLDIVPTFTLMWIYTYLFSKSGAKQTTGLPK